MSDHPSSFQRDLPAEGEDEDIIFISGTAQCTLCPSKFVLNGRDTPDENVKRRQFLHNLFKQMKLDGMCPCLNPRPHTELRFPLCNHCFERVESLWTCQVTLDSLLNTRESLLELVRESARLGVMNEVRVAFAAEILNPTAPHPPPIITPEKRRLEQIRKAIAFSGRTNMIPTTATFQSQFGVGGETTNLNANIGNLNATSTSTNTSTAPVTVTPATTTTGIQTELGEADSSTGVAAEETITGADGQVYEIIPRKMSTQVEDDVNIIKCVRRIHGQIPRVYYMCRWCRFTIMNKFLRFLKGKERPYQTMKGHVRNCQFRGCKDKGSSSKPSTSVANGNPAPKNYKRMTSLQHAPGAKPSNAGGGGCKQTIVDGDGNIYKITHTWKGPQLGILTCSRSIPGGLRVDKVYMCRDCKFKVFANHNRKLVGKDTPFRKIQSHIRNCRKSPECVVIDLTTHTSPQPI